MFLGLQIVDQVGVRGGSLGCGDERSASLVFLCDLIFALRLDQSDQSEVQFITQDPKRLTAKM